MELDGRIIIAFISIVWIVGVACISIDFFRKPPTIIQVTKQKSKYDNHDDYENNNADFLLSPDLEDSNIHADTFGSNIFDSIKDTNSLT